MLPFVDLAVALPAAAGLLADFALPGVLRRDLPVPENDFSGPLEPTDCTALFAALKVATTPPISVSVTEPAGAVVVDFVLELADDFFLGAMEKVKRIHRRS